ncbi:Ig-like domain-containing protein [Listeria costaricensis]|uniref:Ig-like domain-containing protein n=1 Tax=Listeria costaricensis TaxID=2026604 RepID=UPI000C0873A7|nr:Ig-like domain-containing protein [Listeria costaricensis]
MSKKSSTVKKVAAGFVAVNVLASTVLTTIPFNVLAADAELKVVSSEEKESTGKKNVKAGSGHVIKSEDVYVPEFTILNGKVQNWTLSSDNIDGASIFNDTRLEGLAVNPSYGYAINSSNARNIQMIGGTNSNYGEIITGIGINTSIPVVPNRTHQFKYSLSGHMEEGNLQSYVGDAINRTETYTDVSKPYNVNQTQTANFKISDSQTNMGFSLNKGNINFDILSYNLMYESQWNQIDALFGDPDHTTLGDGVTAATVDAAQKMKDNMKDNLDATEMQAELDKAWALVQFADTTISGQILSNSTTISGTGEPNQPIQIKKGSEVLASGTVGADGKYSFEIPAQPKGTVLEAVVNCYDRQEKKTSTVVIKAIETTTINNLSTSSKTVSGTAEPEKLVIIKNSEGTTIASGYSDASGNYSFPVSGLTAGDTITASVSVGDQTSSAQTIVKDDRKATAPTVQDVKDVDTTLNGKGTAGDKITVKIGDATYTGQVDADGNFAIPIPRNKLAAQKSPSSKRTRITQAILALPPK